MARSLSLNVGKDDEGYYWLCLVDMDGDATHPVAQFVDENRMKAFTLFMKTMGFETVDLPTTEELNKFFE